MQKESQALPYFKEIIKLSNRCQHCLAEDIYAASRVSVW